MYVFEFLFFYVTFACVGARLDLGLPETAKNPFQYLEEQNYPYENHTVITEDGYRLLLVRIPYGQNDSSSNTTRPPVLFVHGILANFYDFLVTGPKIAFGFKALEQGYDVFFLNVRGSRWSRSHIGLDPDKNAKQFFNFSFHEIGIYDLPATVDYIINITKFPEVSYVGYSQGCTTFFVMASSRPEVNKKIKVAALLGPVSYLEHAKIILLVLFKPIAGLVQVIVEALPIYEILPYTPILSWTVKVICSPKSIFSPVCRSIIYKATGPSAQINNSMLSTYFVNFPSGVSTKQLLHFLQNARSKEFQRYNYGKGRNELEYGDPKPPHYNLTAISTPVALYYGDSDYFVAVLDERRLAENLPNIVENVLVPYNKTDHFDTILGKRAVDLFTIPALNVLNKYNNL